MKRKMLLLTAFALPVLAFAEEQGQYDQPDKGLSSFAGLAAYISLISVIVLSVLFFSWRRHRREVFREMYRSILGKVSNEMQFEIANRLAALKMKPEAVENDQLETLKKRVTQLELALRTAGAAPVSVEIVNPPNPAPPESPVAPARESENKDVFYLSTPNADGTFNVDSVQPVYRPGASIYYFRNISADKAVFKIDQREMSVKMAMRYPSKSIDPVCETLDGFNPQAKQIITKPGDEGEAKLSGDKWIVTRKAKISYE